MQLVPNTIVSQVPCPGGRHNQTNNTQEYYFYDFYTYIGPGDTFILNAAFNLNIEQGIFNSTLNPQMIQNPDYSYY